MRSLKTWLAAFTVAALGVAAPTAFARQTPTTTTNTEMRSFEVVSVNGNKVVVRGQQGTQEITVTDDYRFTVDGKQVSVHDLKPGMKGTARITTTTTVTPVTVTEVKSGEVMQVAGGSITVKTDQGFKMFTEGDVQKRGVTIMRDGKAIPFSQLNRGDRLTATIITEQPPKVVTQRDVDAMITSPAAAVAGAAATAGRATGTAVASAARATGNAVASGARAATGSGSSTSGGSSGARGASGGGGAAMSGSGATRQLPKTASPLPLIGTVGLLSIVTGLLLTSRRLRRSA